MTAGFTVDVAALDAHAHDVDALAVRMRRVADAGRPLDIAAYGLIGQVFAQAAIEAARSGSAAVGGLAEHIVGLGAGVRSTAAAYADTESRSADTFRGIR